MKLTYYNIYVNFKILILKYIVTNEQLIKYRFKKRIGREVELTNPVKYNDKIQWLKLNWDDPIATICADKYEVRKYVENKIGAEYLNNIFGVYENTEDIDLEKLPEQFVLKGTHGSGYNIICQNKDQLDWPENYNKMNKWLRTNSYWNNREPVYKNIKPRIISEELLIQDDSDELRDYRFFCFNGRPKFIAVDFSINDKNKTRRNLYDLNWNLLDAEITYPKEMSIKVKKPEKLNEMIELSRKLSADFPHTRIDFYYINNKIIFGEITFFHQSGMGRIIPEEFEITMGNWLNLPS